MILTTNQTIMLLCIYRGNPELKSTSNAQSQAMTAVFGGTMEKDRDTLESYGLITQGSVDWSLTLDGMTYVEGNLLGRTPRAGVDPAAEEAKAWLRKAEMTHSGYQGEHDEGGAVFKIGGVPMSGPSVYDFGYGCKLSDQGISPQRTYAAFTEELMARWNRGPIRERKPSIIHDDQY